LLLSRASQVKGKLDVNKDKGSSSAADANTYQRL